MGRQTRKKLSKRERRRRAKNRAEIIKIKRLWKDQCIIFGPGFTLPIGYRDGGKMQDDPYVELEDWVRNASPGRKPKRPSYWCTFQDCTDEFKTKAEMLKHKRFDH